jgi:hypothetical protein
MKHHKFICPECGTTIEATEHSVCICTGDRGRMHGKRVRMVKKEGEAQGVVVKGGRHTTRSIESNPPKVGTNLNEVPPKGIHRKGGGKI